MFIAGKQLWVFFCYLKLRLWQTTSQKLFWQPARSCRVQRPTTLTGETS
ncbi:hypothetical protein BREV_BREV_02322 [Brevundimonas mediterranea]|jgi:hypothetical protein|uniref:Uncharacterized protein n=1 Tax=Brevundimonas mediterranea TaxID=74329 RepID=A0A7Z8Y563_9CAUL|nr:hypothetical protein BREV_BREV_02322 [Brevundimonas mediterranea]